MKVAFVFMLCIGALLASPPYKQIGEFKVKDPSFLQLFPQDHGDVDALWITTFSGNPFTPGQVLFAKNIANQVFFFFLFFFFCVFCFVLFYFVFVSLLELCFFS